MSQFVYMQWICTPDLIWSLPQQTTLVQQNKTFITATEVGIQSWPDSSPHKTRQESPVLWQLLNAGQEHTSHRLICTLCNSGTQSIQDGTDTCQLSACLKNCKNDRTSTFATPGCWANQVWRWSSFCKMHAIPSPRLLTFDSLATVTVHHTGTEKHMLLLFYSILSRSNITQFTLVIYFPIMEKLESISWLQM